MEENDELAKEYSRIVVLRLVFFTISALMTVFTGLIIVRKLGVEDYAIYQSVNKRLVPIVSGLLGIIDLWLYREAARKVRTIFAAGTYVALIIGLIGFVIGGVFVYSFTSNIILGSLAGSVLLTFSMWLAYTRMLDATRPVKVSLQKVITRLLYLVFVTILVYLHRMGVFGAFISLFMGYLLGAVISVVWLLKVIKPKREDFLKPPLRLFYGYNRYKIGLLSAIRRIIVNVDVLIVLEAAGSLVVSTFFALRVLAGMVMDVIPATVRYLHMAGLRGTNTRDLLFTIRIILAIIIGPLVYASIYHFHVAYLLNPKYAWASAVIVIFSIDAFFRVVLIALENLYFGTVRERGIEESEELYSYQLRAVLVVNAYLIGIVFMSVSYMVGFLSLDEKLVLYGWSILRLASALGSMYVVLSRRLVKEVLSSRTLIKDIAVPSIIYGAIAVLYSLFIKPQVSPSIYFWEELRILAEPAILFYIMYLITIFLVDSELREFLLSLKNMI